MISAKRFDKLKAGDIVLYNGRPRTVRSISLPVNGRGARMIGFSILRRSWTGRIHTLYCYHEIKRKLSLPRKKRDGREICRAEEDALRSNGFDLPIEVDRELAEIQRLQKLGLGERGDTLRLLKHVKRKLRRRKKVLRKGAKARRE